MSEPTNIEPGNIALANLRVTFSITLCPEDFAKWGMELVVPSAAAFRDLVETTHEILEEEGYLKNAAAHAFSRITEYVNYF